MKYIGCYKLTNYILNKYKMRGYCFGINKKVSSPQPLKYLILNEGRLNINILK